MKVGRIEREALQEIAAGERHLSDMLGLICSLVQEQVGGEAVVSLMLLDEDNLLYVRGGPCVPPPLKDRLNGLRPGVLEGNCGAAVYTGRAVYVEDTSVDASWEDFRDVAQDYKIRSCWSHPIRVKGKVLGSFALSHLKPASPSEEDKSALEVYASLAAVAIRADEVRIEGQQSELALQRALRLESLGLLAGEVAHDFNNLLVGVIGGLELASDPSFADVAAEHLESARLAAHQAAALCQRFRSLAGEGSEWVSSSLEELVEESIQVTRGVVKKVDVRWSPLADSPPIYLARTQTRQLLLNLIVNGAEAMGSKGGVLRLSTSSGWHGAPYIRTCQLGNHLPPGHYLTLVVEDEGAGFSPDVLTSAFEPFFSTKPGRDQPRGLGLASVAKIAKAHNASVRITTSPEGTRIEVAFPTPNLEAPSEARVLVIGTPEAERAQVASALEPSEAHFVTCEGEGSASWRSQGPFDLLVLDLRCGWESYEALRVHDRHCRAVLIGEGEEFERRTREYADPSPIGLLRSEGTSALADACKRALALPARPLSPL